MVIVWRWEGKLSGPFCALLCAIIRLSTFVILFLQKIIKIRQLAHIATKNVGDHFCETWRMLYYAPIVLDVAVFVLKKDVKLQPTNLLCTNEWNVWYWVIRVCAKHPYFDFRIDIFSLCSFLLITKCTSVCSRSVTAVLCWFILYVWLISCRLLCYVSCWFIMLIVFLLFL